MVVKMDILNDTISFIKTLSFVDIVFFLAVLVLMLLVITLIYFIIEHDEEIAEENLIDNLVKTPTETKATQEMTDLQAITKALEEAEPSTVNLNMYEEEQEEKAIISYDELLKHKNDFALNYSEEENIDDDLTIKKVDLDNLVNKEIKVEPKINVTMISYEKEEAFLEALRTLQQKLN